MVINMFLTDMVEIWMLLVIVLQGIPCDRGQQVTMDGIDKHTTCTEGLIANTDTFTIKGTAYMCGVEVSDWPKVEIQQKLGSETDFGGVCLTDLEKCDGLGELGCHCKALGGGLYKLEYSKMAVSRFSQASFKFVIQSKGNKTVKVESEEARLPPVFAPRSEVISLTINNSPVDISSRTCKFTLQKGTNTIKSCCSESPSPCEVTISHKGTEIKGSPCAAYGHLVEGASQGTYSFTHSVCGIPHPNVYTCQFSSSGNTGSSNNQIHKEYCGLLVTLGLLVLRMSL